MKTDELRMGNYVKRDGMVLEAFLVGKDTINKASCDKFDPIDLDDDWLLRFGCKKSGLYTFIGEQDRYNLSFGRIGYMLQYVDKPIKYVHQLQNIMYDLAGIELTAREQNK